MAIISVRKFEVEDFISVEHGDSQIGLTIFHGKIPVGSPQWATQMLLDPKRAREVAEALLMAAQAIDHPS